MDFSGTVQGHSHIDMDKLKKKPSDPSLLDLIVNLCLANLMDFSGTVLGHSHIAWLTCPQCTACLVGLHSDPALLDLIANLCLANPMEFRGTVLGHSHIDRAGCRLVLNTHIDKLKQKPSAACVQRLWFEPLKLIDLEDSQATQTQPY